MKQIWINLDPKKQTVAVYVLTSVIMAILFSWMTVPLSHTVYDRIALYVSLNKQIAEAPQWDAISQKMRNENDQMQQELASAGGSLLGIQKNSDIVTLLNTAADGDRIKIGTLKPLPADRNNRIEIDAAGSYHDIGHFIFEIEKSRTMIWIEAAHVTADVKHQGLVHALIQFGYQ
jgi:hypothetical protein